MDSALQPAVLNWEPHKSSLKIHKDTTLVGVTPVGVKSYLFALLCSVAITGNLNGMITECAADNQEP